MKKKRSLFFHIYIVNSKNSYTERKLNTKPRKKQGSLEQRSVKHTRSCLLFCCSSTGYHFCQIRDINIHRNAHFSLLVVYCAIVGHKTLIECDSTKHLPVTGVCPKEKGYITTAFQTPSPRQDARIRP